MLILFILPVLICIFNLYRRLLCVIKVKFTKFTSISLIIVFLSLFLITYISGLTYMKIFLAFIWWLSFFTSLICSGISEKGFIQPWYLIGKLYKWQNLRFVSIEKKDKTFMLSFKVIRELRQEYDIKDLEKVKQFLKEKANIKIKK